MDLSHNAELTSLSCSCNELTSLDVSNNPKLTSLACVYNELTSLNVSNNPKLTSLDCHSNQLTTLDVSKTGLGLRTPIDLNCCYNPLKTLYLKTGWQIHSLYIPDETEIVYVD